MAQAPALGEQAPALSRYSLEFRKSRFSQEFDGCSRKQRKLRAGQFHELFCGLDVCSDPFPAKGAESAQNGTPEDLT